MRARRLKTVVRSRSRVPRFALVALPLVLGMACNGILGIGEPKDPPGEKGGRGGDAGSQGEHGGESGDGRGGAGGSSGSLTTGGSTIGGSGGSGDGEDAGNGGAGGEDAGNGGAGGEDAGNGGFGGADAGTSGSGGGGPIVITIIAVEDSTIQDGYPGQGIDTGLNARSDVALSCLLRWDLSSIPPGSSIEDVEFEVYVWNDSSQPMYVYPMRASWSELSVSWTHRDTSTPWQVPGAKGPLDRGTPVGALLFDQVGFFGVSQPSWIALVQSWVDAPSTNLGISLSSPNNTQAIKIVSKDMEEPERHPRLTVTYFPPAAAKIRSWPRRGRAK